ncbi:MAG: diacylglycerol kinase family protein [Bacilli bacterium]|nr:diacylglycerol kinase family protein [Bacilli bacterium]
MKSCTIIYNPNSGHVFKTKYLKEYKNILTKNGYNPKFIGTQYSGHAKEIVNHLEPTDLVISMGGDGTFNEVMSGNLERKKPLILAHIPVGTTNDVGVMFGYGKDIKKNLKLLLDGTIKGMDICVINGRPFVYVAGFGKFMQIPYNTPRKLKKKYGYMAYLLEGVKDFFNPTKMYDITYKVNGIEKRGLYSFMLISNANRIAGINNFYKDVKLDDDQFEVLFCNFKRRVDIIKTFTILMTTDIERVSGVEFYKTNHLEIKFADYPKKAWCIDGEKLDRAVLNYEISNVRNVKIMMPKKNIDKIFVNKKV